MDRAWILVGMMGAGKSAVGRKLAEVSGRTFTDTDSLLQNRFGRSVSGIFSTYGEEAFRDHETSILKSLEPGPLVVATGGGIVLREANWEQLNRLGIVLYLRGSAETLIDHLGSSMKKRPLLNADDWQDRVRSILAFRSALYEKAHAVIDIDGEQVEVVTAKALTAFKELEAC